MTLLSGTLHLSTSKQLFQVNRTLSCSFTAPISEGKNRLAFSATASTSSPSLGNANRSAEQKGSQQRDRTSKQAQTPQGHGDSSSSAAQPAKRGRLTGNVSGKKTVQEQKPAGALAEAMPDSFSEREAFQKRRSPHAAMRAFQQANPLLRQQGAQPGPLRTQLRAQHTAASLQQPKSKEELREQPSTARRDVDSETQSVAQSQRDAATARLMSTALQPVESAAHSGVIGPTQVPRREGVTDGRWNKADVDAVREAMGDAAAIARPKRKAQGPGEVLLGKSREELEALALQEGFPAFRGKQLYDGIMKGAHSIDAINNIPKALKEALAARGVTSGRSLLQHTVTAKDGTRKFLLQLHDGRVVETVGIPADGTSRLTVCVSSQVGCPMRCTFCATGKGGFARNLLSHEIIDQVMTVQEAFGARVSNVVFMGMGEPLLNMRSVLAANKFLNEDVGIGARHITISSVGVPNAIMKLAGHKLQNTLAISIHAPNQALRERLVPSARVYPIEALMMDCREYFNITGRRISFEYTLMAGVNDGIAQAKELAILMRRFDLRCHVNVIPWNPVDESEYQRPSKTAVKAFTDTLEAAGVTTTVRITRGLEAAAACGQLRNMHQKEPMHEFSALT